MMKKLLYMILAVFALLSCADGLDRHGAQQEGIVLTVYNSPMTKVADAGEAYERTLSSLDCFFYPKGATGQPCVFHQRVQPNAVGQALVHINASEEVLDQIFASGDQCDVFVIANLPAEQSYASKAAGTDVKTLSARVLQMGNGYDDKDGPFAMAGLEVATMDDDGNVSGTIPLYRASAKVTITINVPNEIVEDGVSYTPVLTDMDGNPTPRSGLHYGFTKSYLYPDADRPALEVTSEDFYSTPKTERESYKFVSQTVTSKKYTCQVPFYSYARQWEKGAENAAYLTLELPWRKTSDQGDQYRTYYYQILVNAAGREFKANRWYDLNVNVGVLGNLNESEPVQLKDMTLYVLDWTTEPEAENGDRYEDVVMKDYKYLVVPEKRIEISNTNKGDIYYDASHQIGIMMDPATKPVEILDNTTTKFEAYYVYCGPERDASGNVVMSSGKPKTIPPAPKELPITSDNFTDDGNGKITYNYQIPSSVYSPVYSHIIIWLDFDQDGVLDTEYPDDYQGVPETEFMEYVTIVQYPPIYIIPDQTVEYSIYVNKESRYTLGTGTSRTDGIRFRHSNGNYYGLGVVPGTNSTTGHDPTFMYTVTVSSLKPTDVFYYNSQTHSSTGTQTPYKYVIGDPRSRINDILLNDDNHDTTADWASAPSIDGTDRKLQYYYPTSTEPGAFQIIAPKFRVVSFHGNGHQYHNYEGAKMRCASYQEDGYPAGRWRLPTFAELQFIVKLQEEYVICPIFYGSSKYFTPTTQVTYNASGSTFNTTSGDFTSPSSQGGSGSVRCVYDEWYWGSQKDAIENTASGLQQGQEYVFTWGDKKIW